MSDYADLFCELFDGLDRAVFRAQAAHWSADERLAARVAAVAEEVLAGTADADELRAGADGDAERYATLRGLDRAFAHANPATASVVVPALAEYALRYIESGRFDSGARPGALLPRFVRPGRLGQVPDDLADAFLSVVRVPAEHWSACEHVALPAWARLTRPDREGGLRVAATPLIADPEELDWRVVTRGAVRFYRISPSDQEATRARIAAVVKGFDDAGAILGVAPELCLSPALLEDWRAVLAGRERAATSSLRLVLVGTGNVDASDPPSNTAVVLDAQTGEPLAEQRKVYPFNLTEADLDRWGLGDRLGAPVDEDLAPGDHISIIEAGGARIAILVCEDLARLHAFSARLCAHGVSLVLVPVFALPTKDRRWERARAEVYGDATGASIVVANSLVMASVLGRELPVGTAIAVAPGHGVLGEASRPDDVLVFSLGAGEPALG